MTGKQHTAQNVGGPVITITTIRHSLQWHTLSSRTVKPLIFFSLFLFSFLFTSCSHAIVNPEGKTSINISVEDISCTEVWLKVHIENGVPGDYYILRRNVFPPDYVYATLPADTVIKYEWLAPNREYELQLISATYEGEKSSSSKVKVKTLDTSSSIIRWESWLFGNVGSSEIKDLAIVNDSEVIAVGAIEQHNAQGQSEYQNHLTWDGTTWNMKCQKFIDNCRTSSSYSYSPIQSILAFGTYSYILGSYSRVSYNNKFTSTRQECITDNAEVLWGLSLGDYYTGGYYKILHFNGVWQQLYDNTNYVIQDMWGVKTPAGVEVLAIGNDYDMGPDKVLVSIKNNVAKQVSLKDVKPGPVYGVWFKPGKRYYLAGNGVFRKEGDIEGGVWRNDFPRSSGSDYYMSVRGTDYNNIAVGGGRGRVMVYNGMQWYDYKYAAGIHPEAEFYRIAISNKMIVLAGWAGAKAVITIGRRY